MRTLKCYSVTFAVMLSVPANADTVPSSCAGFTPGASTLDVDTYYAVRAADIVAAGMKGNVEALKNWVSSGANYEIWNGDATFASRQRGVTGSLEMAKALKATRFQSVAAIPSPVTISPIKCTWKTTVLFRDGEINKGVLMDLDFADGLLVQAKGKTVFIFEGVIQ
jgi:hypothetical protein